MIRSGRALRRHQLGLVLLGMTLAKTGDRKVIQDKLIKNSITSPLIRWTIEAVFSGDAKQVYSFFEAMGVCQHNHKGKRVVDAVIDELHAHREASLLETTLAMILTGNLASDLDTAEKRLEAALALVRNAKAGMLDSLIESSPPPPKESQNGQAV